MTADTTTPLTIRARYDVSAPSRAVQAYRLGVTETPGATVTTGWETSSVTDNDLSHSRAVVPDIGTAIDWLYEYVWLGSSDTPTWGIQIARERQSGELFVHTLTRGRGGTWLALGVPGAGEDFHYHWDVLAYRVPGKETVVHA